MYKLFLTNTKTGEEKAHSFASFELACLYRDYHLAFGSWSTIARWISEKQITEPQKKFIVEENYIGLEKFFKVADGFEVKIQKEDKGTLEETWMLVRQKRSRLLSQSDWTQLADSPLDTQEKKEWRAYRQYLRNFTKLHNDDSIIYAKIYSFEEFKSGKR